MKPDLAVLQGQEDLLLLVPPTSQDALRASVQQEHEALQASLLKEQDALQAFLLKDEAALQVSMQASMLKDEAAPQASMLKDEAALQASMQASMLKDEAAPQASMLKDEAALQASMLKDEAAPQASMLKDEAALQASMLKDEAALQASMLKDEGALQASLLKDEAALQASMLKDEGALQASMLKDEAALQASMLKDEAAPQASVPKDHAVQENNASLKDNTAPKDYAAVQQQESSGAQQQVPPAAQLDLISLRSAAPEARRDFKAETLQRVQQHEVRRLTSVWCDADAAWSLELLCSAAAVLEELGVCNPREEHLWAVHVMPRLRRLHLSVTDGALDEQPPLLPALAQPSMLQWLGLNGLPRATAQSLLQAHGAALDVLVLFLGAEPGQGWTRGCSDLDVFLGQCGLRLTQLVLWRWVDNHDPAVCAAQLAAARRAVMPSCSVRCSLCQRVPDKCFL